MIGLRKLIDFSERGCRHDTLERHGEWFGSFFRRPRVGPRGPELPRVFACPTFGTNRLARVGDEHFFFYHGQSLGFRRGQPYRTSPGPMGTHGHAGRHLSAGDDPSCR